MNIAIDCNPVNKENTGIGNYVYNLIKSLQKIDDSSNYFLYFKHPKKYLSECLSENFQYVQWDNFKLIFNVYLKNIDIVHGTSFKLLLNGKKGGVVTIHDLAFVKFPQYVIKKHQEKFLKQTRAALKKATYVIAVSENTAKDLIQIFKINENKIKIIYQGIDEIFKPIDNKNLIKEKIKKFGIDKPYILYVGTLEPRKNIPALLKAYASLDNLNKNYVLVLAGMKGWLYEKIFKTIEELKLQHKIILTGYVKNEDLPFLYSGAKVFVYPSFYEGFGLPPLEAMACGCPVITSNVSSLPEVVGDSGILVNPDNVEEISSAIYKIIDDEEFKKKLSYQGIERAKKFSWEKTALETLNIYKEIYNK